MLSTPIVITAFQLLLLASAAAVGWDCTYNNATQIAACSVWDKLLLPPATGWQPSAWSISGVAAEAAVLIPNGKL
jgi:hypothetical protein